MFNRMNELTDAKEHLEKALEIQQTISSDINTDEDVAKTLCRLDRCLNKMNELNIQISDARQSNI